jgi:hypothetical protein
MSDFNRELGWRQIKLFVCSHKNIIARNNKKMNYANSSEAMDHYSEEQSKLDRHFVEEVTGKPDGLYCHHFDQDPCYWGFFCYEIEMIVAKTLDFAEPNNCKRKAAYRQMTYTLHGFLGKENRKELPKCCVEGIRDLYPNHSGICYMGFKKTM